MSARFANPGPDEFRTRTSAIVVRRYNGLFTQRPDLKHGRPLVVDPDGTLIRSDILIESGLAYLKSAPHLFYRPAMWFAQEDKPALKAGLSESAVIDVATLPHDPAVLAWLDEEPESGRPLVLATATTFSQRQPCGLLSKEPLQHTMAPIFRATTRESGS